MDESCSHPGNEGESKHDEAGRKWEEPVPFSPSQKPEWGPDGDGGADAQTGPDWRIP